MRNHRGRRRTRRPAIVAAGTGLVALSGMLALLGPSTGSASSHREAPLIAGDPQADNTDVYAFAVPSKPEQR